MASPVATTLPVPLTTEEALLTRFRDELFGGSWGRFEFELRRLLQGQTDSTRDRDARILADLQVVEDLRRRQAEFLLGRARPGARRTVTA